MYKVMIFGTGKLSQVLEKSLNKKVNVVGYIDNNKDKWKIKYKNRIVIGPDDIKKYKFNYILIASQFNKEIYEQLLNLGVNKKMIFQFSKYLEDKEDYVNEAIRNVLNCSDTVESLITGISYAKAGFREEKYNKKSVNIAYGSQDLYYDYNLVKFLFEQRSLKRLKEVIIGLSYYSFQYDMSLSSMNNKVILYYKNIYLSHNVENIETLVDGLDETIEIAKLIFNSNEYKYPIFNWMNDDNKIDNNAGKLQANIDCKKDYPRTVEENIEIFKNYLELLRDNNIKPVVVIFPTSKYYMNNFSKRIEDEFNNIINEISKKYKFQYIDYFKSDLFTDSDFDDVSHLNKKGAEKFTEILNEIIK